jgi:hypothetical protein
MDVMDTHPTLLFNKSFLVLFCKKELLSCLLHGHQHAHSGLGGDAFASSGEA